MTESLNVSVDRRDGMAVIYTKGYINNEGGEEIANRAYELMDDGVARCCSTSARRRSSTRSASASSSRSSRR